MHANLNSAHSLTHHSAFFLLVVALSVPFWLLGGATGLQLMSGLPVIQLLNFIGGDPLNWILPTHRLFLETTI